MNEQANMMNQQQQQQQQLMNMNQSLGSMNQMNPRLPPQPQPQPQPQQQPQMAPMSRSYGMWPQPQQFPNPNLNPVAMKPRSSAFSKPLGPRNNWKGKRVNMPNDKKRIEQHKSLIGTSGIGPANVVGGGNLSFNNYNPPTLNELQHQNRLKTRKYFPKKKFNKNGGMNMHMSGNKGRFAPFAPRNTTSFIIRAKKSGGIAPLVSPYPVTPAVLPTPILSPSGEVLGDMAKEEWGVDGYGSMKGLIRLRSSGHEMEIHDEEEEDEGGSSESDVEEHVEVERRLDHDLSRFEMIYDPSNMSGMEYQNVLENRIDDQDTHIAQLEEENLILKERLFLMERELGDLRRRLLSLERRGNQDEDINEEIVESESESGSGCRSRSRGEEDPSKDDNDEDFNGENSEEDRFVKGKGDGGRIANGSEVAEATEKIVHLHVGEKAENQNEGKGINAAVKTVIITKQESKEESIHNADELIPANNTEEKIAEMDETDTGESKYVDVEVETTGNIDAERYKYVIEGDGSALDGEVPKDDIVLKDDVEI